MTFSERSRGAGRRRTVLTFEGLEDRRLMTVLVPYSVRHPHAIHALAGAGMISGGSGQPVPPDLGPPTPHEAAKERFVATLIGSFVTTTGRFQNQPVQGLILATGTSNQSLRLNSQFQFFLYSDPAVAPTGQIALSPRNVSSTGTLLLLDLQADPNFQSHGLPTHYTFTVNSGSGGLYTNATGQGTLDVRYKLSGRPRGVHSAGHATVTVRGTIVTTHGLTLDIAAPGNRTSNP